ncbi:hypothetical protein HMPREF0345_1207 [Enterococcus faecalis ATCC 29200]|nr:hypothetical protein HMPREF0345_1207 [Enterococcus faecalis ATCC 29200]
MGLSLTVKPFVSIRVPAPCACSQRRGRGARGIVGRIVWRSGNSGRRPRAGVSP